MIVTASAPVRIDLAGAWTDCSPFSDTFGGATVTIAVAPRVFGTLETRENRDAIIEPGEGVTVSYHSPVPTGAGLGSSAAMNVVWLAMVRRADTGSLAEKLRIAELAFKAEQMLGIMGGRQDQYSSACGGVRLYRFTAEGTEVVDPPVPDDCKQGVLERLVLLYTGRSRFSSKIHEDVWARFAAGDRDVLSALFELRASAEGAASVLSEGRLDGLGEILSLQTRLMLSLSQATYTPGLDELVGRAGDRVLGAKPTGAGGGGCVLLLCREPEDRPAVEQLGRERGWGPIPVTLDEVGLTVEVS
jgi:D-glycero-alpha-D-manno-heptose-7-phosphate kinase